MRRLLAAALIAAPIAAHAWGPDGHQTVATLAAGLIKGTPAEARVAALLGDLTLPQVAVWADCAKGIAPGKDYTYPAPGKYADCAPLETPARIAEMADYVRRNDRQCQIGMDEDSCHRQTHYADIALQRSRYALGFVGTRSDDVVGSLRQAILVLQGKPTTGQPNFKSPREALLVLVHLVGDIHQPLHVGAPYLDAQGRRVDPDKTGLDPASFTVGGNSLWIVAATPATPPSAPAKAGNPAEAAPEGLAGAGFGPVKLHTIWDGVPDKLKPERVDAAWLAQARKVHTNLGDPADWPARWATQSLEQAGTAYEGLKFSARQGSHWTVSLPSGYSARADAIKRQQLTLAGARLAFVLKAVFPN
ncbi:S1/P1 nuclease [Roseateles sp. BYS78W]|uniref:S1/P1 nuclease n=1 Tax=Pelomonas candidula TaxID=3299025 RepID=A0ABW7HG27_9BURK